MTRNEPEEPDPNESTDPGESAARAAARDSRTGRTSGDGPAAPDADDPDEPREPSSPEDSSLTADPDPGDPSAESDIEPETGSAKPPREASSLEQEPATDGSMVHVHEAAHPSKRRRAPRYGRFAFTGFVVGLVLAIVLTALPIGVDVNARALFLILAIILGGLGILAGYTLALILDRRSIKEKDKAKRDASGS